jgi:hypothetical protein
VPVIVSPPKKRKAKDKDIENSDLAVWGESDEAIIGKKFPVLLRLVINHSCRESKKILDFPCL